MKNDFDGLISILDILEELELEDISIEIPQFRSKEEKESK